MSCVSGAGGRGGFGGFDLGMVGGRWGFLLERAGATKRAAKL